MAEAGTVADVASFGVSDTGLSQYRTPAPVSLPIADQDLPYQPIPLTEFALGGYRLSVPGLSQSVIVSPDIDFNDPLQPLDIPRSRFADPRPLGSTIPIWFYRPNGTLVRDADIREGNAKVLAAYALDNRQDLIQQALTSRAVSTETLDLVSDQLPSVDQARRQKYIDVKYQEAYDRVDRAERGNTGKQALQMGLGFLTAAISVVFPPAAPFVVGAYAAYTLARIVPEQVKTGKVTVGQLVQEVGAVGGVVVAASSAFTPAAQAGSGALGTVPTVQHANFPASVPLSGQSLQVVTAEAIGQPLIGTPALQAGLFSTPVAPALSEVTRLGVDLPTLFAPGLLEQAGRYTVNNPGKVLASAEGGARLIDSVRRGDVIGAVNVVLSGAGANFSIPRETPSAPPAPRATVRPITFLGGNPVDDNQPSDPASANPWPWILGALFLSFIAYGIYRKG